MLSVILIFPHFFFWSSRKVVVNGKSMRLYATYVGISVINHKEAVKITVAVGFLPLLLSFCT